MLRIGEFSILSSISIHMLRHYDEIGLLVPEYVDKFTGYRYYKEEQLLNANQILSLKSMGFGLKKIDEILKERPSEEFIRRFLEEKTVEKENEIKVLQGQLQQLKNAILETGNRNEFASRIAVKDIPKRQVVSYRSKIGEFSQEGLLWTALYEECNQLSVEFSNMEYNIAVLHEVNTEKHYVDVEIQKTVEKITGKSDKVEFKTVDGVKVASLVFQGGYSKLKDVNAYVAKWILDNNYELSGNLFSIYHISPGCEVAENEFITEVCFPIKRVLSF